MEYNFKHTPKPWVYNPETNEVRTLNGYYIAYADVDTPKYAEQEIANAKLIAAAPDLLEALMYVRDDLNMILGQKKELAKLINNAIEKAIK